MSAEVDAALLARRTSVVSAAAAAFVLAAVVLVDGSGRGDVAEPEEVRTAAIPTLEEPPQQEDAVLITRREKRERPALAKQRIAHAAQLGAKGAAIDNPCAAAAGVAEHAGELCAATALEPFFRALDGLHDGSAAHHARVAVLGNSLIASDHIFDVVRERLVERFGDGGRGFLLTDRIADYGPRARAGQPSGPRWSAHNFSMGEPGPYPFGVAGVLHVSRGRGTRTTWSVDHAERARLFFYDHPRSPAVNVLAGGEAVARFVPERSVGLRTLDVTLPEGAESLTLDAEGAEAVSYGVFLERKTPGVIVSTFGVPAADATHFLTSDRAVFEAQLLVQDPSLVVVMLGGNETKRLHWGRRSREDVEVAYGALLDVVRELTGGAACLAVGPIDSVYGGPEKVWRTRTHLAWVIEMQQRLAREKGCAYFNLFDAMGGAGSLRRFSREGLLHEDLVHPKQGGLDLLGELLADALLSAYEGTPRVEIVAAKQRRLASPAE